jgi:plasmid stability protein
MMANLSVRNIDDTIFERLRIRAAQNGVSMEEEVRRIIQRSVASPERLGQLALECFGPAHGVELELPDRQPHQPIELDE